MKRRYGARNTGEPPGTVVRRAESSDTRVDVIRYRPTVSAASVRWTDETTFRDGIADAVSAEGVTWLRVAGTGNDDALHVLADVFSISPLELEDIQNRDHRAVLDIRDATSFAILSVQREAGERSVAEQVALLRRDNVVITFEERPGTIFDAVRERIFAQRGRIVASSAAYLFYALVDAVVDWWFPAVDTVQRRMEETEAAIVDGGDGSFTAIHAIRHEVVEMRRALWPLREEFIRFLARSEGHDGELAPYWRDVQEHVLALVDIVGAQREEAAGLVQLHAAVQANELNRVMKTLTVVGAIFIPLTFIAGVYGMNFVNMPELGWTFGYPAAVTVMALVAAGMVWYFRKKRWF